MTIDPRLPVVVLFVRLPTPGATKTRLARVVGAEAAAALYATMAECIAAELMRLHGVSYRLWLYGTPASSEQATIDWLGVHGARFVPQPDGELAERLEHAAELAFAEGASAVAMVGSDVPAVTADAMADAFAFVSASECALGRSPDGGFWTVALGAAVPGVFRSVAYGTHVAAEELRARLLRRDLRIRDLPILTDVDETDDWRVLDDDLRRRLIEHGTRRGRDHSGDGFPP